MKTNFVKRRLFEGKPALGLVLGMGSPVEAEMLTHAGFDFLVVDNQHGAWNDESTMHAFWSMSLGPALPMARVRQNDFYAIGRLLDRGALGIIVPMVNSAEEARQAAYAVRYPPRGGRSLGHMLAQYHGGDYEQWIDDEVFLAVQIESAQAVERAEEILAVEGVDGCWVGPSDLARSMGVDAQTPAGLQARDAAILSVVEACRKTGKVPGIHAAGGAADARKWLDHGFLFVTVGSDHVLLLQGAQQALRMLGRLA
jgi:4-hydroxy-2-oxoheptanedioate aldolase